MSRGSTLSALGLYKWDNNLFDLFVIPEGLDKDTLIDNLLAETAELEILYPNPVVLKNLMGVWSNKNLPVWTKLYQTTQFDYNPIENYNRIENSSDTGTSSTTHSGTDTHTLGGTDTSQNTKTFGGSDSTSGSGNANHYVAGFDSAGTGTSDGLVKQSKDDGTTGETITYGRTETDAGSVTYGKTDTMRHGETIETDNNGTHNIHARGNIGVTTTQEMIEQERRVDRFNIYDYIIEEFKMRFCILVY